MAIDLIKRNQCHNFIIVEKSSGIGGTWKFVTSRVALTSWMKRTDEN
jgi:cation diffusion facilitator CzcD-associated flavoprotein CzcO